MISIITPVYNAEEYLEKCIQSVQTQSYTDWEWIIIDDGSTDRSKEILEWYAQNDPRIITSFQLNRGPAVARNVALNMARGDYVTFLDSDDWMTEGALLMISQIIKNYSPDMILWNFMRFSCNELYNSNNPFPEAGFHDTDSVKKYLLELIFREKKQASQYVPFVWLRAIKKDIIRKNGLTFDERLKRSEDLLFSIQLQSYIQNMYVLPEAALTVYRTNDSSISHSYISGYMKMVDIVYEKICQIEIPDLQKEIRKRADLLYVYRALFAAEKEVVWKSPIAAIRNIREIMILSNLLQAERNIGEKGKEWFGRRYELLRHRHAVALYFLLKIKNRSQN